MTLVCVTHYVCIMQLSTVCAFGHGPHRKMDKVEKKMYYKYINTQQVRSSVCVCFCCLNVEQEVR